MSASKRFRGLHLGFRKLGVDLESKADDGVSHFDHATVEQKHQSPHIPGVDHGYDLLDIVLHLRCHMGIRHDAGGTITLNSALGMSHGFFILFVDDCSLLQSVIQPVNMRRGVVEREFQTASSRVFAFNCIDQT